MSQSSQCLWLVVPLAMYEDQSSDHIFLRLLLKYYDTKSYQSITCGLCISLWKWSQLELLRVIDFTFYLEIRELPNFFEIKTFETNTKTFLRLNLSRTILRLFWDQNFRDRYWVFFFRPNIFETDNETFLRPNFLRLRLILTQREKSRYWEVLRRDTELCQREVQLSLE